MMWFTFLYADLIPIGAFLILFGFCLYYWVDKYNLLRRSSLEGNISGACAADFASERAFANHMGRLHRVAKAEHLDNAVHVLGIRLPSKLVVLPPDDSLQVLAAGCRTWADPRHNLPSLQAKACRARSSTLRSPRPRSHLHG